MNIQVMEVDLRKGAKYRKAAECIGEAEVLKIVEVISPVVVDIISALAPNKVGYKAVVTAVFDSVIGAGHSAYHLGTVAKFLGNIESKSQHNADTALEITAQAILDRLDEKPNDVERGIWNWSDELEALRAILAARKAP